MSRLPESIVAAALGYYNSADRFTRGFVQGKLNRDPAYAGVMLAGVLPLDGLLVDLGCGRGLLLAVLAASGSRLQLLGVERRLKDAAIARQAIGSRARIDEADVARYEIPACDAVSLIDVLHYLDRDVQDALLARIAKALRPGGVLVVREADAGAGLSFVAVRVAERCAAIARGGLQQHFAYRARAAWVAALEAEGFDVWARPMREGTPFANDIIIAKAGFKGTIPVRTDSR